VRIIMDVLLAKLKVLHQPQLASLLIALLNSQNNRRALSRGRTKASASPLFNIDDFRSKSLDLTLPLLLIFIYIHGFKPVYMQDNGQLPYFCREVN
jgi:hypothetical protein